MGLLRDLTRPVSDLTNAVWAPLRALFVVGLCAIISAYATPHGDWVKWVALGMGIAVLVAWARAARTLFTLGLVALVGWWIYRRYGPEARARFDDWAVRTRPHRRGVIEAVRNAAANA